MYLEYIVKNIPIENYTINDILQNELSISKRLQQFLTKNKLVLCNNYICNTNETIKINDKITVNFDYPEDNSNIVPTQMNLDIIYEDEWILILNKPSGIATHPSILHYSDSLSNGVRYYFDIIDLKKKIRPVNRLDFYTSGLVIFAKCSYIHDMLSLQMQDGTFSKMYLALINGKLESLNGIINLPIARKKDSIIERCVDFENGKKAITQYEVIKYIKNQDCTLVKCNLLTGRTHQIRVHFSAIGHPLAGDTLYGNTNDKSICGQKLHCYCLDFIHPITKKHIVIKKDI